MTFYVKYSIINIGKNRFLQNFDGGKKVGSIVKQTLGWAVLLILALVAERLGVCRQEVAFFLISLAILAIAIIVAIIAILFLCKGKESRKKAAKDLGIAVGKTAILFAVILLAEKLVKIDFFIGYEMAMLGQCLTLVDENSK